MKSTTTELVQFGDPFTDSFLKLKTGQIIALCKMQLSQDRKVVSVANFLFRFRGMVEVFIRAQATTED